MTIYIENKKINRVLTKQIIDDDDNIIEQIIQAWLKSDTCHHFYKDKRQKRDVFKKFKYAINKNKNILNDVEKVKEFFIKENYIFSTKAEGRKETLYFRDRVTRLTGRLRQQHGSGPLAKIDKNAKKHLFVSEERYKSLHKSLESWRSNKKKRLPTFYSCEKQVKFGKYHIEFSRQGKKVHPSEGTVEIRKKGQCLKRDIDLALKDILGITR